MIITEPEERLQKQTAFTRIPPSLFNNPQFMAVVQTQISAIQEHLLLYQVESFYVQVSGILGEKGLFTVIKTGEPSHTKYAMLQYPLNTLAFPLRIVNDATLGRPFLRNCNL